MKKQHYNFSSISTYIPGLLNACLGIWGFWQLGNALLPDHPILSFLSKSISVSFVGGIFLGIFLFLRYERQPIRKHDDEETAPLPLW